MKESAIENKIRVWCNSRQLHCLKNVTPSVRGFPDRMILCPWGQTIFIEIKQPGGKRRVEQKFWIDRLRDYGFVAGFVESLDDVQKLIALSGRHIGGSDGHVSQS